MEAARSWIEAGGKGDGTSSIETISHVYGRQAVVVSIDPRRHWVGSEAEAQVRDDSLLMISASFT